MGNTNHAFSYSFKMMKSELNCNSSIFIYETMSGCDQASLAEFVAAVVEDPFDFFTFLSTEVFKKLQVYICHLKH